MKGQFCIWLTLCAVFFFPPIVQSRERCIACHAQKGSTAYVDIELNKKSVHGELSCRRCHIDIIGYPHRRSSRVQCGVCHFIGTLGAPEQEAREYEKSVHGKAREAGNTQAADCQDCHGSHDIFPSTDRRSHTFRGKIPSLCSRCHKQEYNEYSMSIHGHEFLDLGNIKAAICTDCHMEHHLIENINEPDWKLYLIKECGSCHRDKLDTYRDTIHGQVSQLQYVTVATCPDCHGSHNILPVNDQGSTLSEQNRVSTCRKCHPDATRRFTHFYAHPDEHDRMHYPVLYYTYLFMTTLLIGVFTFFFIHTFLWAYRTIKNRMHTRREMR